MKKAIEKISSQPTQKQKRPVVPQRKAPTDEMLQPLSTRAEPQICRLLHVRGNTLRVAAMPYSAASQTYLVQVDGAESRGKGNGALAARKQLLRAIAPGIFDDRRDWARDTDVQRTLAKNAVMVVCTLDGRGSSWGCSRGSVCGLRSRSVSFADLLSENKGTKK